MSAQDSSSGPAGQPAPYPTAPPMMPPPFMPPPGIPPPFPPPGTPSYRTETASDAPHAPRHDAASAPPHGRAPTHRTDATHGASHDARDADAGGASWSCSWSGGSWDRPNWRYSGPASSHGE
ncbi:unnamed protein product [Eretmochelys imbricata]